ncbi:hypothetical protein NX059_010489 [Plenodomus lindquistii]|nr:hypothetical protein NX059_010489 [Plenodomus lindquistii]
MTLKLDTLPIELLLAVCDILYIAHAPSLKDFSLVNRRCRRAAVPQLFRQLTARCYGSDRMATRLQQWKSIMMAYDGFKYVRHISIKGQMHRSRQRDKHGCVMNDGQLAPLDYETPWMPWAAFLVKLPALQDLVYSCESPFPSCLLTALHANISRPCRLHIKGFSLPSLIREKENDYTEPLELEPSDLALITSPCLFSVEMSNQPRHAGKVDFNMQAVMHIAARKNSALEEVQIAQQQMLSEYLQHLRPFPGLKLGHPPNWTSEGPRPMAKLKSLSLFGQELKLQEWQSHTDFDTLQTLKLTGLVSTTTLMWAAKYASFPSLLSFELESLDNNRESNDLGSAHGALLDSLPPLKELIIHDRYTNEALIGILDKHSVSLQKLVLPQFRCWPDLIRVLRESCKAIEHLSIMIDRREGDAQEAACYTQLGLFPLVETLHLKIDCSVNTEEAPLCDDPLYDANDDKNLRVDHVRRTFVNCAIDSSLAGAIYRRIACAKPSGSVRLKSVVLDMCEVGVISKPGDRVVHQPRDDVYQHFTRVWLCSFNPRDDCRDEVLVTESEMSRWARNANSISLNRAAPSLRDYEAAFRKLWPVGDTGDWRNEWSSFPLAE